MDEKTPAIRGDSEGDSSGLKVQQIAFVVTGRSASRASSLMPAVVESPVELDGN